ncbi:MAG: carbohydrate kinase family protein [Erysipelotrichaceae bacterium]|nr:carbohydrate kinase family protein [Erysipelotrichaceae bacterium]
MKKIYVVGGANVDVLARSFNEVVPADSNPGHVSYSFGGVAHNIACNLAKMGCYVDFVTALSNDAFGKQVKNHCLSSELHLDHCQYFDEYSTSLYVAIVQPDGEMNVAVSDMEILSHLDVDEVCKVLKNSEYNDLVVLDTNLTEEQIAKLINSCHNNVFVDPISTTKAVKIIPFLENLYFLKPNHIEAAHMTGIECTSISGCIENLRYFLERGVENIVISMGEKGVIASDGEDSYLIENIPTEVVSTTGAGDSFMAGYIYGQYHEKTFLDSLFYAMASSRITLGSQETVNPDMSSELLENNFKEVKENARLAKLDIQEHK